MKSKVLKFISLVLICVAAGCLVFAIAKQPEDNTWLLVSSCSMIIANLLNLYNGKK